jgi:hypothetical protein
MQLPHSRNVVDGAGAHNGVQLEVLADVAVLEPGAHGLVLYAEHVLRRDPRGHHAFQSVARREVMSRLATEVAVIPVSLLIANHEPIVSPSYSNRQHDLED